MRYCNAEGIEQLSFEDIDYQRLNDIKAWIRANSGESTRYKADSYIRAAYRVVIRLGNKHYTTTGIELE